MATSAQITANRANAQHSTGPTTPEGIAACRHNALKHGLTGREAVIKGEDPAQYDAIRAEHLAHYRPATPAEAMLVESITINWWRLQRARRAEAAVIDSYGQLECLIDPEARKAFNTVTRYLRSIERSWQKACADLQKLQQQRTAETEASEEPAPQPIGSVSQTHEIRNTREEIHPVTPIRYTESSHP